MKAYQSISTVCILFLFLFSSCIDTINNKLIIGNWKAVNWMEKGVTNEYKTQNTYFSFDDKLQYTFTHNDLVEKGTYKVENDMLFTIEEGMQEISVKIALLNADSLIFDMNNGGTPEKLILTRLKSK